MPPDGNPQPPDEEVKWQKKKSQIAMRIKEDKFGMKSMLISFSTLIASFIREKVCFSIIFFCGILFFEYICSVLHET